MTDYKPMNATGSLSPHRKKPAEPIKEQPVSLDLPDPWLRYCQDVLAASKNLAELPDPRECAGIAYEAFHERLWADGAAVKMNPIADKYTNAQLRIMAQHAGKAERVRQSDFPAVREAEKITDKGEDIS